MILEAEEDFLTRRLNNKGARILEVFFLNKAKEIGVAIGKNEEGENLIPDALISLFIIDGVKHVEEKLNVKILGER